MAKYVKMRATYTSDQSASDIKLKIRVNAENMYRQGGKPVFCFSYDNPFFIRWIPAQSYGMQVDFYFDLNDDNGDGTMVELACSHALSPKFAAQGNEVIYELLAGTGCRRKLPENDAATANVGNELSTWWATIKKAFLS